MFDIIQKYLSTRYTSLYILNNNKKCNDNYYLLKYGGTHYCIKNDSNTIDTIADKTSEKGLFSNIPTNANDPIYINIKRLKEKGY